ncbi:MAG: ATP synthase F1 subunit delta [Lachnospiraceae bacterium]|nr:ATP synthase F1 subunit delta [Lachnospiraceae bacterium]
MARIYGGSLYELAAGESLTDTIREQMLVIRDVFRENPDYLGLLGEPSIAREERTGLIEAAFGDQAERYLVNFLKLLCEKGILREFSGCCEEFTRRYNADHNIAEAVVTSAVALSDAQAAALKEKLEKQSGKQILLVQRTDPSLMGGLRVELEGKQLDGSVKARISGISRKLKDVVM